VSANFSYSFAPLSMTLFTLLPEAAPIASAPQLEVFSPTSPGAPMKIRLHGQAGARYVFQSATNLTDWVNVSTNTAATGTVDFSYPVEAGARYWRALWPPQL
jgi:hypothetical protein